MDLASIDHALMTTRAVRRRLDLTRDVPDQVVLDCIDVAEQAPTGGNQGSRRWLVIRDRERKERLAELYLESAGSWMIDAYERIKGTGHPNERVMASASYLPQHLAEVPVIVIPTIIGRHDGSGKPGLFDSVIQSAWSFCVALRARGLGSAWVTAVLNREAELHETFGIPFSMTSIVMLPVAYTVGTDFRPATRYPAREITYFDHFSRTLASTGDGNPSLADGPGVTVEIDIKAPPTRVWELVSDIDLPGRFSDEFQHAEWSDGFDGPAVGATFVGTNHREDIGEWQTTSHVVAYEPESVFAWNVSDPDDPGAQWHFQTENIAGAVRLRFHVTLGPGPSGISEAIAAMPDKEARIVTRRQDEHRANMERVLEGIKELAEARP